MADIFQNIVDVSREVGAIGKDNQNTDQGFKYRGIEQIINALHPIMAKHGIFVVPMASPSGATEIEYQSKAGTRYVDRCIFVTYRLYAKDGSYVEGTVPGEGSDSSDKASNKCMSASLKYFLADVFMIPTALDDGDAESNERATPSVPSSARYAKVKEEGTVPNAKNAENPIDEKLEGFRKRFADLKNSGYFTQAEMKNMNAEIAKVKNEVPSLGFLLGKWEMDLADRKNHQKEKLDTIFNETDGKADTTKDDIF